MKLIDLLVKELPKRGGWPEGANYAVQDADGTVKFAKTLTYLHYLAGEWRSNENGYDWIYGDRPFDGNFVTEWTADDNHSAAISMARYECEISKNETGKQSDDEWNGEGLPPVGCECEYSLNGGKTWWKCKIDYIVGTQGVVMLCDTLEGVQYVQFSSYGNALKFRPLQSEAERKRDAAVEAIHWYMPEFIPDTPNEYYHAKKIYDAIAAGKIPGVKLED